MASASSASPFEVLGVAPDASDDEVRRAYRELALLHHPDRAGDEAGGGDEAAFVRVQHAYEAIREPEARRKLDAEARAAQHAAAALAARAFEVDLDEFRCEVQDEEEGAAGEAGEAGATANAGGAHVVRVWRYDCRCGDEFELSEAQIAAGEAVACRSCSLVIRAHGGCTRSTE